MSEREVPTATAQRIIVKFLTNEGVKPSEILTRLRAQFGDMTLSSTQVPIQLVCVVQQEGSPNLDRICQQQHSTTQQRMFTHSFNLWQAHNAAHILHALTTICTLPLHFQELHASLSHSFWAE